MNYQPKTTFRKRILLLIVVVLFILGINLLEIFTYNYFASINCYRDDFNQGNCKLIKKSLFNTEIKKIPVHDIKIAFVVEKVSSGRSSSHYNNFYLVTSEGQIPIVEYEKDKIRKAKLDLYSEDINNFISNKNKKDLNILIDRNSSFKKMKSFNSIFCFLFISLAMFAFFKNKNNINRSKMALKSQNSKVRVKVKTTYRIK